MIHLHMGNLKYESLVKINLLLFIILLSSCKTDQQESLFTLIESRHSHINFINRLQYTEKLNTYTYRNFYNGAGVGIGDFNNDGLPDIYFCGNLVDNKLYINKGDFVFEDITERAGVGCPGAWSTGVSIADVNGDGRADIYVCKSGDPNSPNRRNALFINNGDLTFTDRAADYGLDVFGLSNHAAFFDYDKDGDLDCYLINNSFQSVTEFDIRPGQREIRDTLGGNKLFRNDNGYFRDVSSEAGIYGSKIGFGLGVSVSDVNRDGWPDIYVSNDFFERDYLYINNKNGTFRESLVDQMQETSLGAMGADIADINNDSWPEIFVTEMTPEGNERLKTKVIFESWERYQDKLSKGYYHQFARNTLQLNNRNNTFSEIGRFSGLSATDWSWGALITDLDNDGWKDIFVANGIYKDLLDRDYLDFYSDPSVIRSMIKTEEKAILKIIDMIPSVKVPNYAFHNNRDLTFSNLAGSWGLATPSFSNGAAYADLDNDGDLDLIVNNVNMPPFIYRNETNNKKNNKYLTLTLTGSGKNSAAIGTEVTLFHGGNMNYQELIPMRGFQSTVDSRLHFGLGASTSIDSLIVNWPDESVSVLYKIPANQFLKLDQKNAVKRSKSTSVNSYDCIFKKINEIPGLDFKHKENEFNDFKRDGLLFMMLSNQGPHISFGDVNKDNLEDIYICGAKDSPGALYVQDSNGHFEKTNEELFENDKICEDTDCILFDADGDGDNDLYVASGGNEFPTSSSALADRLYLNDGKGNFTRSQQILPAGKYESTSCVQPADFDKDGDMELFVGIRLRPFEYGLPANGYILDNDGHGNFKNITENIAPGLTGIGMITDMVWADVDNDSDQDMVIVGDWMSVRVLINTNGIFKDESVRLGLSGTEGWWNTIIGKDLNGDGKTDFILGNHGLNSRFKATLQRPLTMYVNDFDLNGSVEQIICGYNGDQSYPLAMKDDLVNQIPSLSARFKKFDDYKNATLTDIFPQEIIQRSVILKARFMESCVMMNSEGSFHIIPLPSEGQFSPVFAIAADDFDHDGICDIILGGNQSRAKPETGIYEAGYGLLLKGKGDGTFQAVSSLNSGILAKGEIRDLKILKNKGANVVIVARNNDSLMYYKY